MKWSIIAVLNCIFILVYSNCVSQISTISNRYIGCAPDTFQFYTIGNSHSGQPWNSGAGSSSSLDSPIFLYNTPGTYKVTIGALEREIVIYPKLNYSFTTDSLRTGCFPFRFNLKDNSAYPTGISATAVNWIYQNGGSNLGNSIVDSIDNFYLQYCFVKMIVNTNIPSCNGERRVDSFFEILDIPKAVIEMFPDSACKVPFTLSLNNKSKDSLRTNLSYLWTWDFPTAGTSTNQNPPNLTFTTNTNATISLEVKNKLGCTAFDTVYFKVDTPTLSITASNKICALGHGEIELDAYDTANYYYVFNSQKRTNGANINYLIIPPGIIVQPPEYVYAKKIYFKGYDADSYDDNVVRWISVTKVKKIDTSCRTTAVKDVLLCQTFPDFEIIEDQNCGFPFRDTIRVTNWAGNEQCWDSISYQVIYTDKYGVGITKDSFNAPFSNVFKKKGGDTVLIYGLDSINKPDSFYRRGPLTLNVTVAYFSKTDSFTCAHESSANIVKRTLFRPHIVDYFNKGCVSQKDSFRLLNFGNGWIDSVTWYLGDGTIVRGKDSIITHVYTDTGIFKAFAIVKNTNGCIDTTNPLYIRRGDSIPPQLTLSHASICISDTCRISISNPENYDQWHFVSDKYKTMSCPNAESFTWNDFYNSGIQYVYLIASKNGCVTKTKDSVFVDGPKFNLDYDFKCSRRDSIRFYLTDTFGIRTSKYDWDFGEGTTLMNNSVENWKKYTADSSDYTVKVKIANPGGCEYTDSTIVRIRKVKAFFSDTLFCKQTNPGALLNATPYRLDPLFSKNAGYLCDYTYSWLMESIPKSGEQVIHFQPITSDIVVDVHLPLDTMNLSLVARDINGCADTMTRRIIVSDNQIGFDLLAPDSCAPAQTVQCINQSSSPWGLSTTRWYIYNTKNGLEVLYDSLFTRDITVNFHNSIADSFRIELTIYDSAFCNVKSMSKVFHFVVDSSQLIVPDSICQATLPGIYSTENNILKYSYKWFVDNSLIVEDTTYQLGYEFPNIGLHSIRLEKTNRNLGCTAIFMDTVEVKPKPRIRIDNSFDTIANKCFPALTKIAYLDSINVTSLSYRFVHNGSPRVQNPSTIPLDIGINTIYSIFTTAYGCLDTIINYDTVYDPKANLTIDKRRICKGDSIRFTLKDMFQVDSILWSFGDGTVYFDTVSSISHQYPTANIASDTIQVGYIVYGPQKVCPYSKSDTILVLEAKSSHHLNNKTDTAYCHAPIKIHNTALKADYLKWSFGDGNTSSKVDDSFTHEYDKPGRYLITQYAYRSPLGCVDSSFSFVDLYPYPSLMVDLDSVCLGRTLDIEFSDTISNIKVFIEYDTIRKGAFMSSPIKVQIEENTSFMLRSQTDKGCEDTVWAHSVVIKPIEEKSWDTIVAHGSTINIPVGYNPYWTYMWSPSLIDPSCENCANPELQILDSIVYDLAIEDYRMCFKKNYQYVIQIYPDILVKVPKAFSPNGDNINDIIYARGFGIKKLLSFKIFNRQGQLLFMTDDENMGWDGYYKDVLQNTDVYYYTYEAESFIPGKVVAGEGNFMLLK